MGKIVISLFLTAAVCAACSDPAEGGKDADPSDGTPSTDAGTDSSPDNDTGTKGNTQNDGPLAENLVGTWEWALVEGAYAEDSAEAKMYEFAADGSVIYTRWVPDDGSSMVTYIYYGTWFLDGNLLTVTLEDSEDYVNEAGESCSYGEIITEWTNIAIVDGSLYFDVIARTSGSGSPLDGE